MNKRKAVATIATLLLSMLFGCANSPQVQGTMQSADSGVATRDREATVVLPAVLGRYKVIDARRNRRNIDMLELTLVNDVPTMRFLKNGGTELVMELTANQCTGDVVNVNSGDQFHLLQQSQTNLQNAAFFHQQAEQSVRRRKRWLDQHV